MFKKNIKWSKEVLSSDVTEHLCSHSSNFKLLQKDVKGKLFAKFCSNLSNRCGGERVQPEVGGVMPIIQLYTVTHPSP